MAKRKLKRTIFIVCEGTHTERIYFEAIGEETAVAEDFAVTVYPDETTEDPTTHALGLVQLAQSKMSEFDEVWAVFDKDGYTKHAETFAAANTPIDGKTVNIAFSSIAFEQWILLHFTRSEAAYPKSADIIAQLTGNNYFPGYVKTAYQETYAQLKDKTIIALENSAWLRFRLTQQGILPATPVYNTNPYTDADVLVKRLLGITEDIIWVAQAQVITADSISFSAITTNPNTITVSVSNNGLHAIVFNAGNLNNHFYLLDAMRNKTYFTTPATVQINPGQTINFTLISAVGVSPGHLNVLTDSCRIMMEL